MDVKTALVKACQNFVDQRLQTIEEIISSHQKALQSETKSSAGDKHETGRAMLQLEMEKASQQLVSVTQMQQTLSKIQIVKATNVVRLGSVIKTTGVTYFLAISAGKLSVFQKDYYAISVSSPIGKLVLGQQK